MFHVNDNKLRVTKRAASQTTHKFEQIADNTLNPGRLSLISHKYSKKSKVLIICGPTATGKTKFALEIAKEFNGELVSADSRQVYSGQNLVYGKDISPELKSQSSKVKWRNKFLKFYEIEGIKVWLYDIVEPDEQFNVAFWHECAQIVIEDILSRQKLPIVVGGTGLFIKSLTHQLMDIKVPRDEKLRRELSSKDADYLFNYLNRLNASRANKLNPSDRQNPRRLIRAIEIAQSQKKDTPKKEYPCNQARILLNILDILQIGLTAPRDKLYRRVDRRVDERISAGAAAEDPQLAANPEAWKSREHQIVGHQLTWFIKQPGIVWFDVSTNEWQIQAHRFVQKWYNIGDAKKD